MSASISRVFIIFILFLLIFSLNSFLIFLQIIQYLSQFHFAFSKDKKSLANLNINIPYPWTFFSVSILLWSSLYIYISVGIHSKTHFHLCVITPIILNTNSANKKLYQLQISPITPKQMVDDFCFNTKVFLTFICCLFYVFLICCILKQQLKMISLPEICLYYIEFLFPVRLQVSKPHLF